MRLYTKNIECISKNKFRKNAGGESNLYDGQPFAPQKLKCFEGKL